MHSFLSRVGRVCARRHWVVIGIWLAVVAGLLVLRTAFGGAYTNSYTVPGSPSEHGTTILKSEFPAQSGTAGQIVFAAPKGATLTSSTDQNAINQSVSNVSHLAHIQSVSSPFATSNSPTVAPNGTVAYASVYFSVSPSTLDANYLDQLNAAVKPATDAGLTVDYGAGAGQINNTPSDKKSEAIGLACALILLFIIFVSVVAAIIPLVSAAFSVLAGLSLLALLAAAFTFPTTGPTIATLLGLGVAVDYGLFLMARHRDHIDGGMRLIDSIAASTARSGSAIVVAGSTVIIAILGLFVAGVPFISALGVSAALVVAVTMVAALTLVPAFMGLARGSVRSMRDLWAEHRAREAGRKAAVVRTDEAHENSAFGRWGRRVSRQPWPWAIAAVVVLIVLTIPLFFIRFGQLDAGTDPTSNTDRRAFDLINEGFGPGANGPLTVIVVPPAGQSQADTQTLLTNTQQTLAKTPDVQTVWPPQLNQAGTAAILNVIPKGTPQDSSTTDLVDNLRNNVLPQVPAKTYLTGATAANIDFTNRSENRLPLLIGVVVLLSLLLLTTAFRSLSIGIKAAVMNLLSVGAAYGVVVAVFQWGWGSSLIGLDQHVPIPAYVPMLMFAIVFGLSMDYEVFLLSRVHESYLRSRDARRSVAVGIGGTARVITTAAAVMVVVFTSFVVNTNPIVKMLAIGMAVSVLIDASVIRMVLVPAVMSLLGDRAWWLPRWLDKVLPHIDIEGEEKPSAQAKKTAPVGVPR